MNKIGFYGDDIENSSKALDFEEPINTVPRKSVVQVQFEDGPTLAYYNDMFDLKRGDFVYVEGKFEGSLGRIVSVNDNFKIRLSDYKKVIFLIDTDIHGQVFGAGSHFLAFDSFVIPKEKVRGWFLAPSAPEDEYVSETDEEEFQLSNLENMKITPPIAERGNDYYKKNRVRYICVDGTSGYAIVEGGTPYEVEFTLKDGMVTGLVCSCFCGYNCKHEFAVMLQLRETLEYIEKKYQKQYDESKYFAAICKDTLYSFVIAGRETGSLTL